MPAPDRGLHGPDRVVGSSRAAHPNPVKNAIEDAYTLVPNTEPRPVHMHVEGIWAIGNNPISEYRIDIKYK